MSLLENHLEQIQLSSNAIAELPFPQPRIFTNALLGPHDITALIRDTEAHERALFQTDPSAKSQRRATRRGTMFQSEGDGESMASRIYAARNNRNQSAVARVLGSDMMDEIKRSAGTSARGTRSEVNIDVLLRGAEILCNVYPVTGAQEKIATLRYRHELISDSIAQLEDRVARNTAELEQMSHSYGDEYDEYDNPTTAPPEVTDADIEREIEEIRELERRKRALEARVSGMERDLVTSSQAPPPLSRSATSLASLGKLRQASPFRLDYEISRRSTNMDGSQAQANQPMVPPQQHSNLIRTDQVQKLPHLNEQQKAQHTQLVRNFWEILNSRDPQSAEYQNAHMRLTQLSQNLMKGMRVFQQNRQQALQQHQQAQAAAAAVQGQPVQRTQSANPQSFAQLLPQIQQKVNGLHFFLPPNISKEQVQTWLPEARLRYGIALQKQEIGRVRIAELRQQFAQRQAAGNMSQEEVQEFKNRQLGAEKLYREGSDFLNKFKEQQESFKAQQQNQQLNRAALPNAAPGQPQQPQGTAEQAAAATGTAPTATAAPTAGDKRPVNVAGPMHPGQAPTPAPHTINSAVNAARNQAGQAAMSPSTTQPGQAPVTQAAGTAPAAPAAPPHQPQQQQPQPLSQQGTPGAQVTFSQTPNPDGSTPTPSASQPINVQGPPRPLSHQAAMAQAAQNYTNNAANSNMAQANVSQAAANPHAHPQGYISNRASENSARNINMAIPKNLNVPPPEPVSMAPARPTLSGGPSHGAMGMMGQPAIQKHPGYVLEGEGQRVLSKKMLDILVRQVTGGGEGEGLTPDAEEFILQMADDFVDDVITAACRLAKLRPSSTLEIRDIQLVLERNYNMRISGFSTDDLRTVKKPQPTQGWTQKMSAVQAAKVTQGKAE
ncbi:hypothetical protein CNMCM8694_002205 [Aspergillus lentulus]|nr:hypothetical protein CNMCM8060_001144 [Aspergillus lentulus]KAF4189470.1 hypothetical protein CNMCM7927_007986 [Aspergillus lentulus]KAF4197710.1 hypothetical protein CNMCM8694_002205 [Aspergillus lentulus]